MFSQIGEPIQKHQKFLITTHLHSDGDGLGSELALAKYLKRQGKEVLIVNPTPLPAKYSFLKDADSFLTYSDALLPQIESQDVVFILDTSAWSRLGDIAAPIKNGSALTICIDHHQTTGKFADIDVIDGTASATGELVYRLLLDMDAEIDFEIAEALYIAVVTDTGSFQNSNTTPEIHAMVGELLKHGICPEGLHDSIYHRMSSQRMRLLGKCLAELETTPDGRVAWMKVGKDAREELGVVEEELEGFIDSLRSVGSARIYMAFIEQDDGRIRGSLRSKGDAEVLPVAQRMGGGGHAHAAGFTVSGDIDDVARRAVDAAIEVLRN